MKIKKAIFFCALLTLFASALLLHSEAAKEAQKKAAEEHEHENGGEKEREEKHEAHEAKEGEAHEHGHEEEEPWADRVGQGKAVEAFDESGRIKLAEKAILRLGIKSSVPGIEGGALRLPREAVQKAEGKAFVYIAKADRWFERRAAKILARNGSKLLVSLKYYPGERIVHENSASLRAAELDLISGEEAGHGH